MKKIWLFPLAVVVTLAGVAGLFLPVVPGWPLIFLGVSLIAPQKTLRFQKKLQRKFLKKDIVAVDEWGKLPLVAGFTTKHFWLYIRKTDELLKSDNSEIFLEKLKKSRSNAGRLTVNGGRFVVLNQVHGDKIAVLDKAKDYKKTGFYHLLNTDGVITNIPELTLLVMTADCLPIFFTAPSAKPGSSYWAGLTHAGWRGTEKQIAKKTFTLIKKYSGCKSSEIRVYFGPRIGVSAYEVGNEFRRYFNGSAALKSRGAKLYFDLAFENRRQLLAAGVDPKNIIDHGFCTSKDEDDFYSFRREKECAGRNISFIMISPTSGDAATCPRSRTGLLRPQRSA